MFPEGRGFVTYRDLEGAGASTIARRVDGALAYYRDDSVIARVEWKARGHDRAPGLHDALLRSGFVPEEPESIMIGAARLLMDGVKLPVGVRPRQVTDEDEDEDGAIAGTQDDVFGTALGEDMIWVAAKAPPWRWHGPLDRRSGRPDCGCWSLGTGRWN